MKKSLRRDLGLQLLAFYLLFVGPVVLATLVFDRLSAQRLQADVKAADLKNGEEHNISFNDPAYVVETSTNMEISSEVLIRQSSIGCWSILISTQICHPLRTHTTYTGNNLIRIRIQATAPFLDNA